jgi:hypothetical protein
MSSTPDSSIHQRLVGLRRQVDQHAAAGLFDRGFDDAVQRLVAVDQRRRRIVGIEAQQRTVRAVGVEADEGQLVVDEKLRQQARHHRLADAALFTPDEVDLGQRLVFQGGDFHGGAWAGGRGLDDALIVQRSEGGCETRHEGADAGRRAVRRLDSCAACAS